MLPSNTRVHTFEQQQRTHQYSVRASRNSLNSGRNWPRTMRPDPTVPVYYFCSPLIYEVIKNMYIFPLLTSKKVSFKNSWGKKINHTEDLNLILGFSLNLAVSTEASSHILTKHVSFLFCKIRDDE